MVVVGRGTGRLKLYRAMCGEHDRQTGPRRWSLPDHRAADACEGTDGSAMGRCHRPCPQKRSTWSTVPRPPRRPVRLDTQRPGTRTSRARQMSRAVTDATWLHRPRPPNVGGAVTALAGTRLIGYRDAGGDVRQGGLPDRASPASTLRRYPQPAVPDGKAGLDAPTMMAVVFEAVEQAGHRKAATAERCRGSVGHLERFSADGSILNGPASKALDASHAAGPTNKTASPDLLPPAQRPNQRRAAHQHDA